MPESAAIAREAAGLVRATYTNETKPILDVSEAVEKKYFHPRPMPGKATGSTTGACKEMKRY